MFKSRTLKRQEARARGFAAQRGELRRTPLGEQQLWVHVLGFFAAPAAARKARWIDFVRARRARTAEEPDAELHCSGRYDMVGVAKGASSWPDSIRSSSTGSARTLNRPRERERQPHGRRPGGPLRRARCARAPPGRGPAPRGIISLALALATRSRRESQARCR